MKLTEIFIISTSLKYKYRCALRFTELFLLYYHEFQSQINEPASKSSPGVLKNSLSSHQVSFYLLKNITLIFTKFTYLMAISSMCVNYSVVSDSATPWTAACQAPRSMEFSRQEYWSGLPRPPPGDLPNPEIESRSLTLQASLPSEPPGKPKNIGVGSLSLLQGNQYYRSFGHTWALYSYETTRADSVLVVYFAIERKFSVMAEFTIQSTNSYFIYNTLLDQH